MATSHADNDQHIGYDVVTISNVQCFVPNGSQDKDKITRKLKKDILGSTHPEVPFVDCRTGENGIREYNDIIVYSKKI